jgi:integrase
MSKRRHNREGSIYPRRNRAGTVTAYQVSLSLPGGHRRIVGTAPTRTEAVSLLHKAQAELQSGRLQSDAKQTLHRYLTAWLENKRNSISYSTIVSYSRCIRLISSQIGAVPIRSLSSPAIQQCYTDLLRSGQGLRSVELCHSVMRAALRQAVRLGIIGHNPIEGVDAPRSRPTERTILSVEQFMHLMRMSTDDPLQPLLVVLASSGPRIGEALALRWSDVDFDQGTVSIKRSIERQKGKGLIFKEPKSRRSQRLIALPRLALEALARERQRQDALRRAVPGWLDNDLVFPSEKGTPLDKTNVYHRFQRLLGRAGLPAMRVHDLRHAASTFMAQAGIDVATAQHTLGHADPALLLNTYTHVTPSMQRGGVMKMDQLFEPVRIAMGEANTDSNCSATAAQTANPLLEPIVPNWSNPDLPHDYWANRGERPGTRTPNLVIKSHLLYQLS